MSADSATINISRSDMQHFIDPDSGRSFKHYRWFELREIVRAVLRAPIANVERIQAGAFLLRMIHWQGAALMSGEVSSRMAKG